jgi:hypothetical protein
MTLGAFPCCNVRLSCVPLDTLHLSMQPLGRCVPRTDIADRSPTRVVQGLLRRKDLHACYRWFFAPPLAASETNLGSNRFLEGKPCQSGCPARPKWVSVASTPCKFASHRERLIPFPGNSFPHPSSRAGSLPKQGVMSARLRGLHPSTSPLRHISVRRTCRALLPWVSLSRTSDHLPVEPSLAASSLEEPSCISPTRRPDPCNTIRPCGGRRDPEGTRRRERVRQRTRSTDSQRSR